MKREKIGDIPDPTGIPELDDAAASASEAIFEGLEETPSMNIKVEPIKK